MRLPLVRRRALGLALLAAAGLSAAACDQQRDGATRVTVIGEAPSIVDPAERPLSAPESVLLSNVAQGLVRFDPHGHVEPGLAERWNVSDDGLSYIFRLASAEWPDGQKVTAHQVARLLRRQLRARSSNPMKDSLGAVREIAAMTDRVIDIRLSAPRPNLLQILAQPEFAIVREGQGTGPFRIAREQRDESDRLRLVRTVTDLEEEESRREEVLLGASPAPEAVRQFLRRETDLVLGGTFADLPYARTPDLPRDSLLFDPAAGLFGLAPARKEGPAADAELRTLLSQAIDRQALIDALDVPGLLPRATILQPGLEGVQAPPPPEWTAVPLPDRRQALAAAADQLFADEERPTLRIALPEGPGAELLLNRLRSDWSVLGIGVERAPEGEAADLKLIDKVAPSVSPAWFLRHFRCDEAAACEEQADELLAAARAATVPAQRYALLAQAAQLMSDAQLFIPIAAPVRWSLVSNRVEGFSPNSFATHTLTGLGERLARQGAD